jgi:hypothetical protein
LRERTECTELIDRIRSRARSLPPEDEVRQLDRGGALVIDDPTN